MITALLVAAAAALIYADQIKAAVEKADVKLPKLEPHHLLAIGLLALAAWSYAPSTPDAGPAPETDDRALPLTLRGLFQGPTAAEDATALSSLCAELADKVEQDGAADRPRLTTGWSIADLRTAAREVRMGGQSIGARQPLVRDAVHRYLDQADVLGKAGGPIGPIERSKWVAAFRDIATAAEAAVR